MNCKNCGGSAGSKGNKHVKGNKFTCYRRDGYGRTIMDVPVGNLTNWSSSDDTGTSYAPDNSGSSCE